MTLVPDYNLYGPLSNKLPTISTIFESPTALLTASHIFHPEFLFSVTFSKWLTLKVARALGRISVKIPMEKPTLFGTPAVFFRRNSNF